MLRRLVEAFGFTEERAEAAIAGWEREAVSCGVGRLEAGYWTTAEAWILEGPARSPRQESPRSEHHLAARVAAPS
jgi:hypothetical protein